jgi:hypothetical protein
MQGHIPDNGSALIVYGPHIGIDASGALGVIDRRGKHDETACCGSLVAAMEYAKQASTQGRPLQTLSKGKALASSSLDWEQSQVNALVASQWGRLERADNPLLELCFSVFDVQDTMLTQIIEQTKPIQTTYRLGGIQINTPIGASDYFLPLAWETPR